jgi:predicted N-formylglutamate amidohydrolase
MIVPFTKVTAMQQRTNEGEFASNVGGAWKSFDIVLGAPTTKLLLLCDHATNLLPPNYGTLGLDSIALNRHIGYDIGALPVALEIGRRMEATVISSRFSRLLIDPNRGEDDPTLIMQLSDGTIVPGNVGIDEAERAKRIASFFEPYHAAVEAEIDAMLARELTPTIASIHSFTEAWRGIPRKWRAAVLWDKDPRLAIPLIESLRARTGFEIGDNEPYSGCLRNDGIYRHATLRGLPNALIEIRQDLVRGAEGQRQWAELLADCLSAIFADAQKAKVLASVDYYGSHTDIEENGDGFERRGKHECT